MKNCLKEKIAVSMVKKGKKRELSLEKMESKHVDLSRVGFNDSSYFAGLSEDGFSFVSRLAFRANKPNENWLKIYLPGEGVWGFENKAMMEGGKISQGNLEFLCIEPGKKWKILFDGFVEKVDSSAQLKLDLVWKSESPIVNFDTTGTTAEQVGKQIAAEKWNPLFFRKLKELKQVHYEQSGNITGTVYWKNRKFEVGLKAVRDHSWGVRNWEDWDRHFWFLGLLNDGSFFNISQISYNFVRNVKAGFTCKGDDQKTIYGIPSFDEINFESLFPKKIELQVEESKGRYIPLTITMKKFFPFKMDDVYYLREAISDFELNGVKGIGIAEMGANMKKYEFDIASTY